MTQSNQTNRKIVKDTLHSNHLNEDRQIRMLLPPDFSTEKNYSFLYVQDAQDAFMFGRLATITHQLVSSGDLEPVIVVGIDVDKKNRTAEYYPDGDRNEAYCRFMVEELFPFVENKYADMDKNIRRVLLGDSLGATVSLQICLHNEHLVQEVISLSGAFFKPMQHLIQASGDLSWLHMWQLIGTEEYEVKTHRGTFDILEMNRRTRKLLEGRNAEIKYLEKAGTHIWGFWQAHLPAALTYFYGVND